jgi:hypothetical protein
MERTILHRKLRQVRITHEIYLRFRSDTKGNDLRQGVIAERDSSSAYEARTGQAGAHSSGFEKEIIAPMGAAEASHVKSIGVP